MCNFFSCLKDYRLLTLLLISTALRLTLGSVVELGNDEVYYITYALYPDLSHFDHPPMVGWFIQFFTLNLTFDSEGWIRLAAIVSGTLSTIIIYLIGVTLSDKQTGWYAALLYNFSVYGFVITGIFIMPDSPQMLFWLLSILFLILAMEPNKSVNLITEQSTIESNTAGFKVITGYENTESRKAIYFLLAGLALGLALLSKYTSIFIIAGTFLFFLRHKEWFGKWYSYGAVVIAFLCFIPVLIWNLDNNFISFTFHSDRVEVTQRMFRLDSFATELGGQILYNNPFNFAITLAALLAFFRKKLIPRDDRVRLLIYIALPVIFIFLVISLFRSTLPHWSGPAYVTLIPLAALWLRQLTQGGKKQQVLPKALKWSMGFIIILLCTALLQIFSGLFLNKGINPDTGKRLGIKDITLDMYGWKQLGGKFYELYTADLESGRMDSSVTIISHRWFPAANIDYYLARDLEIKVLTMAPLERTHKYAWISGYRGGLKPGMDAYFISSTYDFQNPHHLYDDYFTIEKADTIPIYRQKVLVEYFYIWRMRDLKKLPPVDWQPILEK